MTKMLIRAARDDDLEALQDIERAAGAPFRALGMNLVSDDAPPTIAELSVFSREGRAWVSVDDHDRPIAYLLVSMVGGDAYIDQVSVHPDHAGHRIGHALLEVAARWARDRDIAALTLTAYAEVPWNGLYYRRLGFRDVPDDQLGRDLLQIRSAEKARGLDRWPRVAMRRQL